jgi:aminoglycoside 6'-N-acetyltransferase I
MRDGCGGHSSGNVGRLRGAVAEMCVLLWPDGSVEEHGAELREKLASGMSGTLPVAIFVAADVESGALAGFLEVGLRSHAESCDSARPVGYAEGLFVRRELRKSGVGAALMRAAGDWARKQGCGEMASDVRIDNNVSQRVHEALGYEEVDRCVHYRKKL